MDPEERRLVVAVGGEVVMLRSPTRSFSIARGVSGEVFETVERNCLYVLPSTGFSACAGVQSRSTASQARMSSLESRHFC